MHRILDSIPRILKEKFSVKEIVQDLSVWPRTGSNPADIDQFRSQTGKTFMGLILVPKGKKVETA